MSQLLEIKFKRLTPAAKIPTRSYGYGNCWDVFAATDATVHSFAATIVNTGLAFEIPDGYQMHVYNRSSNPVKRGLILSNSVGIIDSDYRGELGVLFHSLPIMADGILTDRPVEIHAGDKIAQFKLVRINPEELTESATLSETSRASGGFGSTDK